MNNNQSISLFSHYLIHRNIAALDDENIPVIIPKAIPETEAGWALYEGGGDRRLKRLNQRQELVDMINASRKVPTTTDDSS